MSNQSLVALILLSFLVHAGYSVAVTLSSLQSTLIVTASPNTGDVLKAGKDNFAVTWSFNQSFPSGTDSDYKNVKVELCYAPKSQLDRSWRKTADDLSKDKTCQFNIVTMAYTSSGSSFTWKVPQIIPTATYFVRAYALNSAGQQVAYGQTTDAKKTTNLFNIQGISGRHVSIDVAAGCFSAFSIISLVGFFLLERRKAKTQ